MIYKNGQQVIFEDISGLITGTIVGYDANYYLVDTPYGFFWVKEDDLRKV